MCLCAYISICRMPPKITKQEKKYLPNLQLIMFSGKERRLGEALWLAPGGWGRRVEERGGLERHGDGGGGSNVTLREPVWYNAG